MTMPPTSLWWDSLPKPVQIRPSLTKDIDVDVAIIGAGYTGLWTAYYLLKKSPNIKIAILDSKSMDSFFLKKINIFIHYIRMPF